MSTDGHLEAYADELAAVGRAAGLDAVGIAPAEPFESTRRDLEERRRAGLHAGMQFTYRNPARSTDPRRLLPGARAIVVGARAYFAPPPERSRDAPGTGAVARYAWRDDYGDLRESLGAVASRLVADGWAAKVTVDDNALVDREAAFRAGLGWYGKNANLLMPGRGSWFVLGSVVTDAPLPPAVPAEDGCGTCTRCLAGCPTGAIVAPGVIDARRCLAWLLQADGAFPEEYRGALGGRIYGCDDCQEVCPVNRVAVGREVRATPPDAEPWVDLVEMLELDDGALLARYGRWYIARRDPRYLRRNALVALGNVGHARSPRVARVLSNWLAGDDDLLREHAAWAARRLGRVDLLESTAMAEP